MTRAFLVEGDQLGRRADALATRGFVELAIQSAGRPDAVRAEWLHFLAILLYDDANHVAEAVELERESLAIRRRTLPDNHVYIVDSMETLANIEAARKNYDESTRLLKLVLDARIAARGPNDITVSAAYNNLGVVEIRRDDMLAAAGYLEHAVEIAKAAGRTNSAAQYNLARSQLELGRWRAAARSFGASLADSERISGEDSRDVAESAMFLGVAWIAMNDLEHGRPMLQRGVDSARRSGSPSLATALTFAGRLRLQDGDRKSARAFIDEAMKLPTSNAPMRSLVAAEIARAESGCSVARSLFDRVLEDAVKDEQRLVISLATVALAECEIETGAVEPARKRLEGELAWLTRAGADDLASAPARALLARLHP